MNKPLRPSGRPRISASKVPPHGIEKILSMGVFSHESDALGVFDEMRNAKMEYRPEGKLKGASIVAIVSWNGMASHVGIDASSGPIHTLAMSLPGGLQVGKEDLFWTKAFRDPDVNAAIPAYIIKELASQRSAVRIARDAVKAAEHARQINDALEGSFRTAHGKVEFQRSVKQLQKEYERKSEILAWSAETLVGYLVAQWRYNHFDRLILKWSMYYNRQLRLRPPLNPALVKSILYQESKFGTQGPFMTETPGQWGVKNHYPQLLRFNLGQAVDSIASQQLIMIREISPELYHAFKLELVEQALKSQEYLHGKDPKLVTNSERQKLLLAYDGGRLDKAASKFLTDPRPLSTRQNWMGNPILPMFNDYEFWIRTSIRWLIEKAFAATQREAINWKLATEKYNGRGEPARRYAEEVYLRVRTGDVVITMPRKSHD